MSSMSDGLNMAPRVKEPDSPFVVPGMGVPTSAPADVVKRAREGIVQPLSIQFPPLIPDTSGPAPQPPGQALQQVANWQYDWTSLDGITGISRATFPGMVNFSNSQSTPTIPVTVAQGGTGQTTLTQGIVTSPGGTGPLGTIPYTTGQNTVTDTSSAGLVLPGIWLWQRVGEMVTAVCNFQFPGTADGNFVSFGGLPYTPNPEGVGVFYSNGNIVANVVLVSKTQLQIFRSTGALIGAALINSNISTNIVAISITYRTMDPP